MQVARLVQAATDVPVGGSAVRALAINYPMIGPQQTALIPNLAGLIRCALPQNPAPNSNTKRHLA